MNKMAVIGDVHGNLPALDSVLADVEKQEVEGIYCIGDIVGYYPWVNECIERVREIPCVRGNHDEFSITELPLFIFRPEAEAALRWTQEHLSEESKEFLVGLPYVMERNNLLFTHASLGRPNRWDYTFGVGEAFHNFLDPSKEYRHSIRMDDSKDVCFFGHTHEPVIFRFFEGNRAGILPAMEHIQLKEDSKYLVNVGSVGQPRDDDPRACYVTFDLDEKVLSYRRVEYDIAKTQAKVREVGLPERLATRLAIGK